MPDKFPRIFDREAVNGTAFNMLSAVVGAFALGEVVVGNAVTNPIARTAIEAPIAYFFYRSYERQDERNRQQNASQ